jgi:hypothetical protein
VAQPASSSATISAAVAYSDWVRGGWGGNGGAIVIGMARRA